MSAKKNTRTKGKTSNQKKSRRPNSSQDRSAMENLSVKEDEIMEKNPTETAAFVNGEKMKKECDGIEKKQLDLDYWIEVRDERGEYYNVSAKHIAMMMADFDKEKTPKKDLEKFAETIPFSQLALKAFKKL